MAVEKHKVVTLTALAGDRDGEKWFSVQSPQRDLQNILRERETERETDRERQRERQRERDTEREKETQARQCLCVKERNSYLHINKTGARLLCIFEKDRQWKMNVLFENRKKQSLGHVEMSRCVTHFNLNVGWRSEVGEFIHDLSSVTSALMDHTNLSSQWMKGVWNSTK